MGSECILILFLLIFQAVNGAIVLWSPKKIEIPALKPFSNNDLGNLLNKLNNPKVVAFSGASLNTARVLHKFLNDKHTAYVPGAKLKLDENINGLYDDEELDLNIIKTQLKDLKGAIVILIINSDRFKRGADNNGNVTESSENPRSSGSVVYSASSRSDKDVGAIIYSSKPPLLKDNGTLTELGDAAHASMDERGSFTRLIATIPVESGKIVLRFRFLLTSGYWYMTSVEVVKQSENTDQFNLTLNEDVTAPMRFSYHCGGHVKFEDSKNNMELYLYDVQVQVDAYKNRFSDAYNCVPFTTGPIWSGIFVTFILAIGLIVGLTALGSIKTMDKFDNHKTKQLSITVSE